MTLKVSDEQFIAVWNQLGSPLAVATALGLDLRNVYRRRNNLVTKGFNLETTNQQGNTKKFDQEKLNERLRQAEHNVRRGIALEKGRVLVFFSSQGNLFHAYGL